MNDVPEVATLRPTYRFDRSYEWNYAHGPDFAGPWPLVPPTPMKSFLGHPVRSRFGIPASILPNSRWVEPYAQLGFDVLTFKTVRSVSRLCGAAPNWVYLDQQAVAAHLDEPDAALPIAAMPPAADSAITTGGSFGMPSVAPPEIWQADFARSLQALAPGQVLIGSAVGTAAEGVSEAAFIEDFARVARWLVEAGAPIIEANFSCPNVGKAEGQLYLDLALSTRIARAVKDAIGGRPLMLKIGAIDDEARLEATLRGFAGVVDALVLINAPARRITTRDGAVLFGPGRERAGVTGAAIKPIALAMVRRSAAMIERLKLKMEIVAVGGITRVEDVPEFIAAGACAAQSATGAMLNPLLAVQLKQRHPEI